MTRKEFQNFLNFMVGMTIIDYKEYSDLWLKALPYLKK